MVLLVTSLKFGRNPSGLRGSLCHSRLLVLLVTTTGWQSFGSFGDIRVAVLVLLVTTGDDKGGTKGRDENTSDFDLAKINSLF